MPKWSWDIRPQRNDGKGWRDCEPHRAQAFAVIWKGQVKTRRPTKAEAGEAMRQMIMRMQPERSFKLARRCPPRRSS